MKRKFLIKVLDIFSNVCNQSPFFLKKLPPCFLGKIIGGLVSLLLKDQIKNKDAKNIICFDRFVFARDLKVLNATGSYNYLSFNSTNLAKILSLYVPKWMQHQVLFLNYIHNQDYAHILKATKSFAEGFIEKLDEITRVDSVLLAGIDYYGDYPFHWVLHEKKIPFIALFYEHYTIPLSQQSNIELYKDFYFEFKGNAIACFGDKTAQVFKKSRVMDEKRIYCTGAPRYDIYSKKELSHELNTFVLFSYPGFEYFAPLNFIFILHEFAKISSQNPHLRYVVKCKDESHRQQVLESLQGMPHLLDIVIEESIESLLNHARMVIGFNSLTVLESLLGPGHIYVPYFADAKLPAPLLQMDPKKIPLNAPGLTFLNNKESIIDALHTESKKPTYIKLHQNKDFWQQRVSLFQEYFAFDPNHNSTQKLEAIFNQVIKEKK